MGSELSRSADPRGARRGLTQAWRAPEGDGEGMCDECDEYQTLYVVYVYPTIMYCRRCIMEHPSIPPTVAPPAPQGLPPAALSGAPPAPEFIVVEDSPEHRVQLGIPFNRLSLKTRVKKIETPRSPLEAELLQSVAAARARLAQTQREQAATAVRAGWKTGSATWLRRQEYRELLNQMRPEANRELLALLSIEAGLQVPEAPEIPPDSNDSGAPGGFERRYGQRVRPSEEVQQRPGMPAASERALLDLLEREDFWATVRAVAESPAPAPPPALAALLRAAGLPLLDSQGIPHPLGASEESSDSEGDEAQVHPADANNDVGSEGITHSGPEGGRRARGLTRDQPPQGGRAAHPGDRGARVTGETGAPGECEVAEGHAPYYVVLKQAPTIRDATGIAYTGIYDSSSGSRARLRHAVEGDIPGRAGRSWDTRSTGDPGHARNNGLGGGWAGLGGAGRQRN